MPLFYGMDTKRTINSNFRYLAIFLAILVATFWNVLSRAAEQPTADLRLLIDVSGSMKKNDPQNLRAPAMRLLVGMLPENAHSGIWTFGQWVVPVVPQGRVDKTWRRKAYGAAGKIRSREMFTDIEQALRKATAGWNDPDPRFRRNVILLTDGLVDISKDQEKNQASRRRLLEELLPRIEASGGRIHTIALSANSDRALMEQLSAATGGWYEQVDDANTLDRLFLRLFEQSATPDTLPLKDNRFTVDGSISDMTVLAFRYSIDESLKLVAPSGEQYSMQNSPPHVQWLRENTYDLVTVENPSQGEWRLDAPEDPDNRVTVVTNLRLDVTPIPSHIVSDSAPALHAHLLYDSANAQRPDFLEWVEFTLHDTIRDSGEMKTIPLWDRGEPPDSSAGDGIHSADLRGQLLPGRHELVVVADGGSFSREYRQMVKVHEHAIDIKIAAESSSTSNTADFTLEVRIEPALLQTENAQIRAYLETESDEGSPLSRVAHNKWQLELPAALSGQTVEVEVNCLDRSGLPYTFSRRLRIESDAAEVDTETENSVSTEENVPEKEDQPPETKATEMSWGITAAFVFIENLLLGLAGWLGYMYWKKRRANKQTGSESIGTQVDEAKDLTSPQAPEPQSMDEDPDGSETLEPQQSPTEMSNEGAESEDQVSREDPVVTTESAQTEENTSSEDSFTIEEFDSEISAGLEAWNNESAVSEFSEEELDGSEGLEEINSPAENAQDTEASTDTVMEDILSDSLEDSVPPPLAADSATTSMPDSEGDSSEQKDKLHSESEAIDAQEPDLSNLDDAAFSIDLSDDSEEIGQEPISSTSKDQYEQNLVDALEGSEELPADKPEKGVAENKAKTGTKEDTEPTSLSRNIDDHHTNQPTGTPEESNKMAR